MCRSKAEGGQRCAAHTRPLYEGWLEVVKEKPMDSTALVEFSSAAREHATTVKGAEEIEKEIPGLPKLSAAILQDALVKGKVMRDEREYAYQSYLRWLRWQNNDDYDE